MPQIKRRMELLVPVLLACSLLLSCLFVSRKQYFWNDELYSWYLLSDPVFSSMWAAFGDVINTSPPLYFVLGWGWAQVFGASELALRLFSSVTIGIAVLVVFRVLRRSLGFWPVAVSVALVFGTYDLVLQQNAEARMYGLFLMISALAFLHFDLSRDRAWSGIASVVFLFLVHSSLVLTHIYGLIYSGAILVAYAIVERGRGVRRFKFCLTIVASWSSFLIYYPIFIRQAEVNHPQGWIPTPELADLWHVLSPFSSSPLMIASSHASVRWLSALLAGVFLSLLLVELARSRSLRKAWPGRNRHLMVFAAALFAVPLVAFLVSVILSPIFFGRYLIPTLIGFVIVSALMLDYIVDRCTGGPFAPTSSRKIPFGYGSSDLAKLAGLVLIVGFSLKPIHHGFRQSTQSRPGFNVVTDGNESLPIAVQNSGLFLVLNRYAEDSARYHYVLDGESALRPESGRFGSQEYKHLSAFARNYPDTVGRNIVESDAFLATHEKFLVLGERPVDGSCTIDVVGLSGVTAFSGVLHCPRWVATRLLHSPEYEIEELGSLPHSESEVLLLVERVSID